MSRLINRALIALAVVCAFGMIATSGEPVIGFLRGTDLAPLLVSLGWQNSIVFNLCVGYLISLLFWVLVVLLPEKKRHRLLRKNISHQYQKFKEEVIQTLLWASIGVHDSRLPSELTDHVKFKEFFSQNNSEHWYAAMNGIQSEPIRMKEVTLAMQMLANEVSYVLNSMPIHDEGAHRLLKNINDSVYRLQNSGSDLYDQVKHVGGFIWTLLARWSFVEGQLEEDPLQRVIDRL